MSVIDIEAHAAGHGRMENTLAIVIINAFAIVIINV